MGYWWWTMRHGWVSLGRHGKREKRHASSTRATMGGRTGDILRRIPRLWLETDCAFAHLLPDPLARARNAVNLGATLQTVAAGTEIAP